MIRDLFYDVYYDHFTKLENVVASYPSCRLHFAHTIFGDLILSDNTKCGDDVKEYYDLFHMTPYNYNSRMILVCHYAYVFNSVWVRIGLLLQLIFLIYFFFKNVKNTNNQQCDYDNKTYEK